MQTLNLFVIFVLTTIAATIVAAKYLSEKPPYLNDCLLRDPNFKKCFTANFQTLFTVWKDGVPGLKSVGKLDPLHVKRIKISQDGGNTLAIDADLQNVVLSGASKAVVLEADLNTEKWITTGKVAVPKLRFDSDFKAKGRVFTINLNGHGKAFFEAENVVMACAIAMKLRDEDGLTFTEIEDIKMTIQDIGGFRVHLDNLFNGQKELEESTNDLFNANWRELFEILRPAIEQTVNAVLLDRFRKVFHYVPANYFVADIPKANG